MERINYKGTKRISEKENSYIYMNLKMKILRKLKDFIKKVIKCGSKEETYEEYCENWDNWKDYTFEENNGWNNFEENSWKWEESNDQELSLRDFEILKWGKEINDELDLIRKEVNFIEEWLMKIKSIEEMNEKVIEIPVEIIRYLQRMIGDKFQSKSGEYYRKR